MIFRSKEKVNPKKLTRRTFFEVKLRGEAGISEILKSFALKTPKLSRLAPLALALMVLYHMNESECLESTKTSNPLPLFVFAEIR